MLQMLSLKTGRTQNQILLSLLRQEFARHGITREQVEEMVADPDRFWNALGRPAPAVPAGIHETKRLAL